MLEVSWSKKYQLNIVDEYFILKKNEVCDKLSNHNVANFFYSKSVQ